jgi:hypothetical protein
MIFLPPVSLSLSQAINVRINLKWQPEHNFQYLVLVLLHLDQHFIERGPYHSERERTLEIGGVDRNANCLIYHMLCIDKQGPGAIQSALSLAEGAKDARKGGERRQHSSQLAPRFRGGRTVCEGLSARLADDLLLLGEPEDHHHQQGHQQQGQKAICKGREKSASDRLCQSWNSKETFLHLS